MKHAVTALAIVCIATLEYFAIKAGLNGVALAGALAIIGGLGGFAQRKPRPPA